MRCDRRCCGVIAPAVKVLLLAILCTPWYPPTTCTAGVVSRLAQIPVPAHDGLSADELRSRADERFRNEDYKQAEVLYRRSLAKQPDSVQTLSNLATCLHFVWTKYSAPDAAAEAAQLYRHALTLYPQGEGAATLWYNLGSTLLQLASKKEGELGDEITEAKEALTRALELKPDFSAALQNLGALQQEEGSYQDAEDSYRAAMHSNGASPPPGVADADTARSARSNLWTLLHARGKHGELERSYKNALARSPRDADIHADLGALFHRQRDFGKALHHYRSAVRLDVDHRTHTNIGLLLVHQASVDAAPPTPWAQEALFHFKRSFQGTDAFVGMVRSPMGDPIYKRRSDDPGHGVFPWKLGDSCPSRAILLKLRFDAEQLAHVRASQDLRAENDVEMARLQHLYSFLGSLDASGEPEACAVRLATQLGRLTQQEVSLISGSWRKGVHLWPSWHVDGPFDHEHDKSVLRLNMATRKLLQESYFEHPRGQEMIVVDDLLSAEILGDIVRFLQTSTIWNARARPGYVGATIKEGLLTHPALVRLAAELPRAFPKVFCRGKSELTQAWAYSYHNWDGGLEGSAPGLQHGIGIHADAAAISANIWITGEPAADAPPGTNGLRVYSKEAPLDWDFKDYNDASSETRLVDFVADSPWYEVPFRRNRMVLFNSNLLHESLPLSMRVGDFRARRINLTLLYGRRGATCEK